MKRKLSLVSTFVVLCILLLGWFSLGQGWFNSIAPSLYEPPYLVVIEPISNSDVTSGQVVLAKAVGYAENGISKVTIKVDDELIFEETFGQPYRTKEEINSAWMPTLIGEHYVHFTAYDAYGIPSKPQSSLIMVAPAPNVLIDHEWVPSQDENIEPAAQLPDGLGGSDASPAAGADGQAAPPENDANGQVPPAAADEDQAAPAENGENPEADQAVDPNDREQQDPAVDNAPPLDTAPVMVSLDVTPVMMEGGDWIAVITADAKDDRTLTRLEMGMTHPDGLFDIKMAPCDPLPTCQAEWRVNMTDLRPGEWMINARAVDDAGQVSALLQANLEVLAPQDDGAAGAVEEDVDLDIFGNFDILNDIFNPILPWQDFDFGQPPAGGEQPPAAEEQPNIVSNQDGCLRLTAEPIAGEILLRAEVLCNFSNEFDRIYVPTASRRTLNSGLGSASNGLFLGWRDQALTELHPGISYEWMDDPSCGLSYIYSFSFDLFDPVLDNMVSANTDSVQLLVNVGPCSGEGVSLEADGTHLTATIPPGVVFGPRAANGGYFRLSRYSLVTGKRVEIGYFALTAAELAAGTTRNFVDNQITCGDRYTYTLLGSSTEGLPEHESNVFTSTQAESNMPICDHAIGLMTLGSELEWVNEQLARYHFAVNVPPGSFFPIYDDLSLVLYAQTIQRGEGRPDDILVLGSQDVGIGEIVQGDGFIVSGAIDLENYFPLRIRVWAELRSGQTTVGVTNALTAELPLGPPKAPILLSAMLSQQCPNHAPRCVILNWDNYQQSDHTQPAINLRVTRKFGAIEESTYLVSTDAVSFIDANPFMREYDLVNGVHVVDCSFDMLYAVDALDAQGHSDVGWDSILVSTPECDQPWNQILLP